MQGGYLPRQLEAEVEEQLAEFPAVAILGPRQCGKSTLARRFIAGRPDAVYLDLEKRSDLARLSDPERFLDRHAGDLVCLDEIQRMPELFADLRSAIDADRRNGRFLILGSASRSLIRQGSESLAGRLSWLELTPFLVSETAPVRAGPDSHHLRGGCAPTTTDRS